MRTYEVWALTDGGRPELLDTVPHIARAASLRVDWMRGRDPESHCAWVQCPERATDENPEGIWPSDLRVIQAADRLVQSGPLVAVACKARDLTDVLAASVAVVEGRARLGRMCRRADLVARVHEQLAFVARFPNIVRAARG